MADTFNPNEYNSNFATNEIGTQLFHYNKTDKKMHYIAPMVEGADFSKDMEKIDTPELDLDYVPSISGKSTLPTAEYIINYDINRNNALSKCVMANSKETYVEAWSDGSGMVFTGDGSLGYPKGNPRTISVKINMGFMMWVENLLSLTEVEAKKLKSVFPEADIAALKPIPFNIESIPEGRISFIKDNYKTTTV